MRITEEQKQALCHAAQACFGKTASIWLFGSRTNNSKHGGDIDLYIETDLKNGIAAAKIDFRQKIWPTFGEQKIDLIVHRRDLDLQPIHEIAKQNGIKLLN